ncbi:VOC family protein [uncultured Jatrophihabitans sp.]|uniref:VOC family protein n=1 Tax=uncultured Jatrophihabitans sp. TaxID=1610747 RepID=UPI0035CABACC
MRLDHVGVNVADLDAAERWYCAAFGLRPELRLRIEPIELDIAMLRHAELGHRVELLHRAGLAGGPRGANPAEAALLPGYSHMAFDVRRLDAEHARLVAQGAREVMAPQPSPEPGVRMSYLADPDGNLVELVERDPLPA